MSIRKQHRKLYKMMARWTKFELLAGIDHHTPSRSVGKQYNRYVNAYNNHQDMMWRKRIGVPEV